MVQIWVLDQTGGLLSLGSSEHLRSSDTLPPVMHPHPPLGRPTVSPASAEAPVEWAELAVGFDGRAESVFCVLSSAAQRGLGSCCSLH